MKATMGTWKRRKLVKGQRASQTKSKKVRLTWAYPPEQGWSGGRPEDNGYKHRG